MSTEHLNSVGLGKTFIVSSRHFALLAAAAVLLGTCGYYFFFGNEPQITAAEAQEMFTPEGLENLQKLPDIERQKKFRAAGQAMAAEFGRNFRRAENKRESSEPLPSSRERRQKMREAVEKLSEADRAAFRSGMESERRKQMQVVRKEMQDNIKEFFAATPEEQDNILDAEISRMEMRRQAMEARRAKMGAEQTKGKNGDRPSPRQRPEFSKEQREQFMRSRLDNSTPAERAQMEEYFRRLRERRESQKKNKKS